FMGALPWYRKAILIKNKKPRPGGEALWYCCVSASLFGGNDRDGTLVQRAADVEFDLAVHQREKRVVLADTDVDAGMELGATLTDDDRACRDQLTAVGLDAKPFRL